MYLDNCIVFASQNGSGAVATRGIESEMLAMDNEDQYPTKELTQEEKDAFFTIAERVIPLPDKVGSISTSNMNKFRNLHAYYNIKVKDEYAFRSFCNIKWTPQSFRKVIGRYRTYA